MAHYVGGASRAPANVKFNCPESGDWITDGNEPIVEFEEPAGVGHQTNTTHGMKCPGCGSGYIKFETGHSGPKGVHKYSA